MWRVAAKSQHSRRVFKWNFSSKYLSSKFNIYSDIKQRDALTLMLLNFLVEENTDNGRPFD